VRDAVLTETFGLDAEDRCSVDAVFLAVAGGRFLFVATAAAEAYVRRQIAGAMTLEEEAVVRMPSWTWEKAAR
jgi:hypothetical protein